MYEKKIWKLLKLVKKINMQRGELMNKSEIYEEVIKLISKQTTKKGKRRTRIPNLVRVYQLLRSLGYNKTKIAELLHMSRKTFSNLGRYTT